MSQLEICILAAGLGKRMKSTAPKVMHAIAGRPMLAHLLDTAALLTPDRIHVVVGHGAEQVEAGFADQGLNFVHQPKQLGTGHAVMQALSHVNPDARLLILLGDAPLMTRATLARLTETDADLAVLTVELSDPAGYGRIIRDAGGKFRAIVEQRDATPEQQRVREINTGVMIASANGLARWLGDVGRDNDQGEYLLTDIVACAVAEAASVQAVLADDPVEVQGINTLAQLAALEREFQLRQAKRLMEAGVQMMDPGRFDLRGTLVAGTGCRIDVGCVFEGDCRIGNNVSVGPNCTLRDCRIEDGAEIRANTVIDGALVGPDCVVGPFARLRPGTELAREVGIGNFVEVKNATIGERTKASHLSYLGDANIGAGVNIGAGTITCNYDGVEKHQTTIADGVFVGSNTALVAPVMIGERSTIAAGSVITHTVPDQHLAVARGRQSNVANWKRPEKN